MASGGSFIKHKKGAKPKLVERTKSMDEVKAEAQKKALVSQDEKPANTEGEG